MEREEQGTSAHRGSREKDSLASVGNSFRAGAGAFKAGLTHFRTSAGSRSTGQRATAKYDYINRIGKYEKNKDAISYAESGNLPEWAKADPRAYWQAADEYERANGRLFVQAEFALPRDVSEESQLALAHEQAVAMARTKDGKPLPYSFAVHEANGHNPHFHLIISERVLDEQTRTPETWFKRSPIGAKKTIDLQHPDWVKETRREWCERANRHLEAGGAESRLDHRTLKEQGIDREPTVHVGYTNPARPQLRQQRQARNETIRLANTLPEARKGLAQAEAAIADLTATLHEIEAKAGAERAAAEKVAASMPRPEVQRQVQDLAQPEPEGQTHEIPGPTHEKAAPTQAIFEPTQPIWGETHEIPGPTQIINELPAPQTLSTEIHAPEQPEADPWKADREHLKAALGGLQRHVQGQFEEGSPKGKRVNQGIAGMEIAANKPGDPAQNLREYGQTDPLMRGICQQWAEQLEQMWADRRAADRIFAKIRSQVEAHPESAGREMALAELARMEIATNKPGDPAQNLREYGQKNPEQQALCSAVADQVEQGRKVQATNYAAGRQSQTKTPQPTPEEKMLVEKARLLAVAKSGKSYQERLAAERQAKAVEEAYLKTLAPAERYSYKRRQERKDRGRGD